MKVLIIGGGGREHALAWKLQKSRLVEKIYGAPGNPNLANLECVNLTSHQELADFAAANQIDLTVVGPEAPLCAGIVDYFQQRNLPIFGPTAAAARLEGSKTFAKEFMLRHGLPTAAYQRFEDRDQAVAYIRRQGGPIVVKADGLAGGKGVTVANTEEQAVAAVDECFSGCFGQAGQAVVIEECLVGEEASIIALVDGQTILPLATSQDHKRVGQNDTGPNTGGMGAYSPAPLVTAALWARIRDQILNPFLQGCKRDKLDYRGVIYAGIMVTEQGPKVLEFNVRFGDPETQAILPRLQSDLAEAMLASLQQRLHTVELKWAPDSAVCVVIAARGYPGPYQSGEIIRGIEQAERNRAIVFHAGTGQDQNGEIISNGGRVLGVTGFGEDLARAIEHTYSAVAAIEWPGGFYRPDIGFRGCRHR